MPDKTVLNVGTEENAERLRQSLGAGGQADGEKSSFSLEGGESFTVGLFSDLEEVGFVTHQPWMWIWEFSEWSGIRLGRFAPFVFGKMMGSRGKRVG